MHAVRRSRVVHAPADRVWAVLDDFGNVWRYHPTVESSQVVTDLETGQGARRECVRDDGDRFEQTILEYTAGEGYVLDFPDLGPFPLVATVVDIRVTEADDDHSTVTFTAYFQPEYGLLGWLFGRVILEQQFEKRLDAILEGLAAYARTGEQVGDGDLVSV